MASGVNNKRRVLVTLFLFCFVKAIHSLDLTLNFAKPPPNEVIVQRNKPLLINCTGVSAPDYAPVTVAWFYEGQKLESNGHYQILPNGSLYIDKIQPQRKRSGKRDNGNYTCLLRNSAGALLSKPIQIIVASMAKSFSILPESLTTENGSSARFQCQIDATPIANYVWYLNDKLLAPTDNNRLFVLPTTGVLQIVNISISDVGQYHCVASNIGRKKESLKITLNIKNASQSFAPPQFLSVPSQPIAVEKGTAILECFAKGYPAPQISWNRIDEKLAKDKTSIIGQGNLLISDLKESDGGLYLCTATNKNPETLEIFEIKQEISLIVHVPPKFLVKPKGETKPAAQTMRFECSAEGIPPPSLHWFKNGEPLYINGRIKQLAGNILAITQTIVSDSGIYQCVATNNAGSITSAARLQVNVSTNQPRPPFGLQAKTISSTSILLSWNPPGSAGGHSIQAYTVHYLLTSGGVELQSVAVNTSQLIEKLLPYTNYTFYVRAYNDRSASEQSETVVKSTGEDLPIRAPILSLSKPSSTSLLASWNELPMSATRGVIVGYQIYYRKHAMASHSIVEVASGVNEYTVNGLSSKQKYDMRVMAGTKAGFPSFTDDIWPWSTHETLDGNTANVPEPPTLHLTVINSTTLEVKWSGNENSDNKLKVKGYKLSFRQKGYPLRPVLHLQSNTTSHFITDLEPQTWYEVYLVAYNKEGESKESSRTIITLPEDNYDLESVEVLEPPEDLEADPISSNTVHLYWKLPFTNKNISYFTIRYHPVFSQSTVNASTVNYIRSTNSEVNITDLNPYALYEFSVRSHDVNNFQGPFGVKVECMTLETIPSAPLDLNWSPIDPKTVRLGWQLPSHPNGPILSYYILYKSQLDNLNNPNNWLTKKDGPFLSTTVTGLMSNTIYYVCVKAETKAGMGPPSEIITFNIPVRQNATKATQAAMDVEMQDPFLGIILGVSIGVCCIIICIIIILCRNRCCPLPQPGGHYMDCCISEEQASCLNGHSACYVSQGGGGGGGQQQQGHKRHPHGGQEMDYVTPMLTTDIITGDNHLDSKGGYPMIANGNGIIHRMSNDEIKNQPYTNGIDKILQNVPKHPQSSFKPNGCNGNSRHLTPSVNGSNPSSTSFNVDAVSTTTTTFNRGGGTPPPVPPHRTSASSDMPRNETKTKSHDCPISNVTNSRTTGKAYRCSLSEEDLDNDDANASVVLLLPVSSSHPHHSLLSDDV